MSLPEDDILFARPTIDLDALKHDSDRGIAAMREQNKSVRDNAREKKTTCGNPGCDHEDTSSTPLKACSKCHSIRYCSSACQKAHWKAHKKSCSSFSDLPLYRDFDPTLVLPGCQYPQSPVFASAHKDGFGCWVAPGGQITGELAKFAGPDEVDDKPFRAHESGYTGPRPEDIRKMMQVMPGPGDILDIRVLVQNRSKEAVFVTGLDLIAVVSKAKLDDFYEGTSSNPEYEKNVFAKDTTGAETTGQRPCYCNITHINGKGVDSKVKKHGSIMDESQCTVALKPTEHVCFNVQYRLGNPDRTLEFLAWDLLDNITFVVHRPFFGGKDYVRGQQSERTYIRAGVDQKEVRRWYADYRTKGQIAFIASHYGEERAKMIKGLHAARDDHPISKLLQKGFSDMMNSGKSFEEYKAEYKTFLDGRSDIPPDVVEGFKKMAHIA
ncbi:unnamed protein product [Peniophora sp. CBMAI 1063]|nr:unnamed protein product [Peniophora sp. CBMAI 1063]